jgi:hypothetical protein
MPSIKDIKLLLFFCYAIGYLLAVVPPIFIDPLLKSHVLYPTPRHYDYAILCAPIFVLLLAAEALLLKKAKRPKGLYTSIPVFLMAILLSVPIFLPERPHGNLIAVGTEATCVAGFAIFVWSVGHRISLDAESVESVGNATLEYLKALLSFVRQGAFAGVALFGALFFAAYTAGFKYVEAVVADKADIFLLNANTAAQIVYCSIFSVIGPVRYFFSMNLQVMRKFRDIAAQLDRKA